MDAFRRFRSRRTSKAQADGFTSFADAESSYVPGTSPPPPWLPTTRSPGLRRPSDGTSTKLSQDIPRLPNTSTDSRSPSVVGRVQPMLVGISRPLNNNISHSRPGTAGSMQRALDQVAEAVAQTSPSRSTTASPSDMKTGRFVDILAITGQPSSSHGTGTYNEDIASRNLDTSTFSDDEQDYHYKPTSKYQEEVASRNAYQIATARTSSLSRRSEDSRAHPFAPAIQIPQHAAYVHSSSAQGSAAKSRSVQSVSDGSAYHSRQQTTRNRELPDQLPSIPQEGSLEDINNALRQNSRSPDEIEKELDRAKARWVEVKRQNQGIDFVGRDKPLPASPPTSTQLRDSGVSSVSGELNRPSLPFTHTRKPSSLYSNDEFNNETPARFSGKASAQASQPRVSLLSNNSQRATTISDASRRSDRLRPPSSMSAHSYKRTLVGNRTIMDLTGEEDDEHLGQEIPRDATSVASYQHTPVLENARTDAYQRFTPMVVDYPSMGLQPQIREHELVVPNLRWSSAQEPVLDLDQLARRSQAMSEAHRIMAQIHTVPNSVAHRSIASSTRARPIAAQIRSAPAPSLTFSAVQSVSSTSQPRKIAFSPINILGTTSPLSSTEALVEKIASPAVPPAAAAAEEERPANLTVDNEAKEQFKKKSSARISANIAPLVKIFADVTPEDKELYAAPSKPSKPNAPVLSKDNNKASASQDPVEVKPVKEIARASKPKSKSEAKKSDRISEKKAIRLAAQSIIPAGPLDQELATGIKTRDFAVNPVEKPTNRRVEALSERKRSPPAETRKAPREGGKARPGTSGERKSRSRPPASGLEEALQISAKAQGKQPEKETEKPRSAPSAASTMSTGKKSSKPKSSSRKSKASSKFDEEAYKKKHAEANAALLRLQQSLQEDFETEPSRAGSTTPRASSITPVPQALSSVSNLSTPSSPSLAALAMITAATTSPRAKAQADAQAARAAMQVSAGSSRSVIPSPLQKRDPPLRSLTHDGSTIVSTTLLAPMDHTMIPFDGRSKPPPSPGEVSLSSFPLPSHTQGSPESAKSPSAPPAYVKDVGVPQRRGSQSSRTSTASAFSIPFTMVPSRLASLPEKRMGFAGPSVTPTLDSIASVIPPTKTEVTSW